MMKKTIAILLSLLLVLSAAACSAGGGGGTGSGENTPPVITGVRDKFVDAGEPFDAFEGVEASDSEDGDITAGVLVRSEPELSFKNGVATPEIGGEYELFYTVKDSGGLSYDVSAILNVASALAAPEVYKSFDLSAEPVTDTRGWEARIGEAAVASAELRDGAYVIDVTNPGGGDGDIQLAFPGLALKAGQYRIKVWAKSTADTYCHFIARNELAEGWETFNAVWNQRIGTHVAPVMLTFDSEGEGSAELLLNLGKITPNPENPADTTPGSFTVTIDKIELYEISGEEHEQPVYTADFASGTGLEVTAGDGAAAEAVYEDGSAVAAISAYPSGGGVWSIRANLPLGGARIVSGVKYYYRLVLSSENDQSGEALVESAEKEWEARAHFNGFSAPAGEDVEISGVFTAETEISDPVIRFQIGNPSDGVSSNRITFKSLEFGRLAGDKTVEKTTCTWMPFGNAEDAEHPWLTFNATDDDSEHGVGVIYAKDGSLFYRIDDAGSVDWHNKLVAGYGENPLKLEGGAFYTVEIKAKADKQVSFNLILNTLGVWDPKIYETVQLGPDSSTVSFKTLTSVDTDSDFELLFQFGPDATADLGEVTVEFESVTIYRQSIIG